jgi:hypothetical protein
VDTYQKDKNRDQQFELEIRLWYRQKIAGFQEGIPKMPNVPMRDKARAATRDRWINATVTAAAALLVFVLIGTEHNEYQNTLNAGLENLISTNWVNVETTERFESGLEELNRQFLYGRQKKSETETPRLPALPNSLFRYQYGRRIQLKIGGV